MVAYFYDNFIDDYDYLYLCGDDTYVILENLKAFLSSPEVVERAQPYLYTGAMTHDIFDKKSTLYYMGGGAGYVLSKSTVTALVEQVFPSCHQNTTGSAEVRLRTVPYRDVVSNLLPTFSILNVSSCF